MDGAAEPRIARALGITPFRSTPSRKALTLVLRKLENLKKVFDGNKYLYGLTEALPILRHTNSTYLHHDAEPDATPLG